MIKGIAILRKKNRPLLDGHRYLTDDELSRLLHINRRTLQDYRNMGRISFIKLGGKVLYREEDVEKLLQCTLSNKSAQLYLQLSLGF